MTYLNSGSVYSKVCNGIACSLPAANLLVLFTIVFAPLCGCGPGLTEMETRELRAMTEQAADSVSAYMPGLPKDTINGVTHHFVRKAEMKCRMKDVRTAVKTIEDLVARSRGYVASGEMHAFELSRRSVRFSRDSVLDEIRYSMRGHMQLKVPCGQLDTLLQRITGLAQFVDYQRRTTNDIQPALYENNLSEKRENTFRQRITHQTTAASSKRQEILKMEEALLEHQAAVDQTKSKSLALADDVLFSTITLDLYQTPCYLQDHLAAEAVVEVYTPSFPEQSAEALTQGLALLKALALLIMRGWSLLAIVVAALWLLRLKRKKQNVI